MAAIFINSWHTGFEATPILLLCSDLICCTFSRFPLLNFQPQQPLLWMQLELLHFLHPLQPLLCSNLNHCTFSDSSSLDLLPRKPLHFQRLYTNAFPANPNRCICSHSESLTFQPLIRAEPILDLALSSRWSGFETSTSSRNAHEILFFLIQSSCS